MYEKDGKRYPFEINEYYGVGLNSLKRIYTQHPKFNGDTRLIYELLYDHWNAEYGYAFPDQWELARESGMSLSSVRRHSKTLEELKLIDIRKSPIGKKNNIYYVNKPIDNITDFFKAFPEAEEHAKERIEKINADEEKSFSKWRDVDDEEGASQKEDDSEELSDELKELDNFF